MSRIVIATACGTCFGVVAVLIMLPMSFPDKRTALAAAFADRFAIGFVIGVSELEWPGWLAGIFLGLLLSLPSAILTKAWAPILGLGALGGLIIGTIVA